MQRFGRQFIFLACIAAHVGVPPAGAQTTVRRPGGIHLQPLASGEFGGTLVQVAASRNGELFGISERPQQLLRITRSGQRLTIRPAPVPSDVVYPAAIVFDGDALQLLDLGGQAIYRLRPDRTDAELATLRIPHAAEFCVLRGQTYAYRDTEASPFARYSPQGELLAEFGAQFGSGSDYRRDVISRARVVCDPETGIILVTTRFTGETRAYSGDGRLLWNQTVPGVRAMIIMPAGRGVTFMSAPGGSHNLIGVSLLGDGLALLQYGIMKPARAGEYSSIQTHVISLRTGGEVARQDDLRVLVGAGNGLAFSLDGERGRIVLNRLSLREALMETPIRRGRWLLFVMPLLSLAAIIAYRLNSDEGRDFLAREFIDSRLPAVPAAYKSKLTPGVEHETLAFLVISSHCIAAYDPNLVAIVDATKGALARDAAARGRKLHLIAISLDDDIGPALRFLARLGTFNEVSIGGNWLNSQVSSLVWNDPQTEPQIPQWIIVDRDVTIGQARIAIRSGQVRTRIVGLDGMRRWSRLPQASAARRESNR